MPGIEPTSRRLQPIRQETVENLHDRLSEAEGTLRAIRNGEVDAVVVSGPRGDQIYTLKNADEPYRRFVERMDIPDSLAPEISTYLYPSQQCRTWKGTGSHLRISMYLN